MSASEDVKTLFRRFGGEPDSYQEVIRERQAVQALGKWAMLGQVDLLHPQDVPGVHRAVKTSAVRPAAQGLQMPLRAVETKVIAPPARVAVPPEEMKAAQPVPVTPEPAQPIDIPRLVEAAAPKAVEKTTVLDPAPKPALQAHAIVPPAQEGMVRATRHTVPAAGAPTVAAVTVDNEVHTSPLAARLKGYSTPEPLPATDTQAENQSLSGLFGRLSTPSHPSPKTGVLRRKFNR